VARAYNPTTQEAEIRRIKVPSQPRQIVCKILSQENPSQKRTDGVTEMWAPSSNSSTEKKKKMLWRGEGGGGVGDKGGGEGRGEK
jgi:hypothetical protein